MIYKIRALGWVVIFIFACWYPAVAAEIGFSAVEIRAGQTFKLPITVKGVKKLAGAKLLLSYDTSLLSFEKAEKTQQTRRMMDIVNSNKPGSLVVVMASATGIPESDFSLVELFFKASASVHKTISTKIKLQRVEMMSESLKTIAPDIKTAPITIRTDPDAPKMIDMPVPLFGR